MASGEDLDRSPSLYAAPSAPPEPTPGRSRRRSVHAALGGGAVADLLLWRWRNASALAALGATAAWIVIECAGYSVLSVFANAFILLVVVLFFWAKSASLFNRPLPSLPNLEVSNDVLEKAAVKVHIWINRLLAVGEAISFRKDRKIFFQVIVVLWVVSYIGSLFNFLTLVYMVFIMCLGIPALYDKYQDQVDEKLGGARKVVWTQCKKVLSMSAQSSKEKKFQ